MTDKIITGNELIGSDFTVSAAQVEAHTISISFNGRPMITIHNNGTLEFGPDYTPDEAARQFWEAVQRLRPDPMTREFGAPLKARINAELAAGERAQKQVKRLDQMAAAWAERLPETINRDTVVKAVHQVTRTGEA
ncbi:hypothetical protein ACIQVL_48755 [Streptomyces sp. NPDC090499]|uniref:hypothetical protein n=1 Tax=Streptomyces sp. NPDC090499 TaxID=3365965 RepID=UPI003802A954